MVLLVSLLALGFGLSASSDDTNGLEANLEAKDGARGFTNQKNHESVLGNYSTAAVASDGAGPVCATIGK